MLEISKAQVHAELLGHVGRENGIHVRDLVARITGQLLNGEALERRVRDLVQELRLEGHMVCAHPASGYFMAATPQELNATCTFLLERASTSVNQVAAMKSRIAPDLYLDLGVPSPAAKGQTAKPL